MIEYGYVAPDPRDPDIVYGAGRGQVSKYHRSTGQVEIISPKPPAGQTYRADRTQPIMFSPIDPHVLFYAANVVFKTTDGGHSWQTISADLTRPHPGIPASLGSMAAKDPGADKQRGVIYSLAPSFHSIDTIWAGTDEGLIWITADGGKNWKDITPPALTPWSKVTQLEASHFDDQSAYASVSRFRVDDLTPYIYRTHDGGKTWQLITAGLPNDAPIDTVREDPVRKGLLFAGSETSVWVSFDDGDHWQSLQLNLPHTSMRDLWIHGSDLIVATHGRSFWILDDITPLRQIDEKAIAIERLALPSRAGLARAARYQYRHASAARRAVGRESAGWRHHRLLPGAARIRSRDARNPGCGRQAGAALFEHGLAGGQRSRSESAEHPAVLAAARPASCRQTAACTAGSGICTARRRSLCAMSIPSRPFRTIRRGSRRAPARCPAYTP